jgi:hypothetical protein
VTLRPRSLRGPTRLAGLAGALALVAGAAACSDHDEPDTPPQSGNPPTTAAESSTTTAAGSAAGAGGSGGTGDLIVFSTEGNNLNAYDPEPPFDKQTVIHTVADDPDGMDINAQICFFPDDPHRFIAGEDTGQPERTPGWGIFEVEGDTVGDLSADEVARLVPTYQPGDNPENYGCGVLSDGRVVTTDIGNEVDGTPSGQLIVWFPPFDSEEIAYCKIDVTLPTAGGITVGEDDSLYVTTARPPDNGVLRFTGPFPTSDDAAGGCGKQDGTGAPLADSATREVFIPADEHALTPNALVPAGDGGFYVTSAFTGTIVHYDADGTYVETVLAPPEGEAFGDTPFSTGTPLGLAVTDDGVVYFADLGLGFSDDGVGPLPQAGSLRRLDLSGGPGAEPVVMDEGLDYPDGIGLYRP